MTRKKMPGVKSVETRYMEEREAVLRALGRLNRREFIKVSAGALGAAAAVGVGLHPHSFTPVSVAFAQPENEAPPAEPGGASYDRHDRTSHERRARSGATAFVFFLQWFPLVE